jgi:hypothetical protein
VASEVKHGQGDEGVGDLKPKVTRVMRRILVLTDSMRPLDRPCSIAARIEALCLTIRRCRSTKVGMRQRRVQPIQASSASTASS